MFGGIGIAGPALLPLLSRDVLVFAVDEGYHVGVLLDAAALTQVGQERPVVQALFGRAAELRERKHGGRRVRARCS